MTQARKESQAQQAHLVLMPTLLGQLVLLDLQGTRARHLVVPLVLQAIQDCRALLAPLVLLVAMLDLLGPQDHKV